jgi:hypothetical protein
MVPYGLRADHQRRGGTNLRRFVATVPGGIMRVMTAREPAGKAEGMIWHISVTIAANGQISSPPLRVPTSDEVEACKSLMPGVSFETADGSDPLARHLWEVES